MWGWFLDLLALLGLFQKEGKLLLLGLDNAGKTTLLHMLHEERVTTHLPTQRATQETIIHGNTHFTCFDLGGHAEAREVWADYFLEVSGIIFVVDANDRARAQNSRTELDGLLTNPVLANVPILVLGNKVDIPNSMSEEELRNRLGLVQTTGKGVSREAMAGRRPLEVFMCSVVQRFGFADGIRWLMEYT